MIEVLLAMAIMAVICGTIYQFTGTTVRVAGVATRVDAREQALGGLRRLLSAQFAALPASESQALTGEANDGDHGRSDALRMLCPAGSAILTPDARGLYWATFEMREIPGGSGRHALVLNREPWTDDTELGKPIQLSAVSAGGVRTSGGLGSRPAGWVRLLDGVRSLQIDYFDPRLNSWVDKWNDPTMSPSLVRMRLALENSGAPYEFIEKVPGGGVPRGALSTILPGSPVPTLPPGFNPANLPPRLNPANLPPGVAGSNKGGTRTGPPTAPPAGAAPTLPPGVAPTLPPGLSVPTGTPPLFDPTKPFMAPDTGTGLPPGFH